MRIYCKLHKCIYRVIRGLSNGFQVYNYSENNIDRISRHENEVIKLDDSFFLNKELLSEEMYDIALDMISKRDAIIFKTLNEMNEEIEKVVFIHELYFDNDTMIQRLTLDENVFVYGYEDLLQMP